MGVASGEDTVQDSPVLSQKRPGRHYPALYPSSGGMMVWDLGTCVRCSWKEGSRVKNRWPLLSPSKIVLPSPQLFFTFLKGILVF